MNESIINLVPMTADMYRRYFREYESDPDLLLRGQAYCPYTYSEDRVEKYVQRQAALKRLPLAILCDGEIVGEIILRDIEARVCATMSITLKNARYKDRGIGTRAERLAIRYVFDELDIPVLYADAVQTNTRSCHVLEKVGFALIREDEDYRYYQINREDSRPLKGNAHEQLF